MKKLNLGTRVEMFAICASIEYDIKNFINASGCKVNFTKEMLHKANERNKKAIDQEEILDQLDLKDYIVLITESPYEYAINNEKAERLSEYFTAIIPVRNRVMHTKPLEIGDRALLIEVMQEIDIQIDWIMWSQLTSTRTILSEDPGRLLANKYIGIKEYNPNVYHNLPIPEFDDTGFVGRKKDIKEILELIKNKKNQVISVVGNGGMGKTAIVVKTLYDLIDSGENHFDAIIWITLKTRTLSKGEFIEIKDGIRNIPDMFEFGKEMIIVNDNSEDPVDAIIKFMSEFNVLLVLDNLETINSGEINSFIRKIPENSKVLITSRLGLGEFEVRKRLDGLEKGDAITYFREVSKYYGLKLHERSNEEIYNIINNDLYNNPLSIKWFISGVFSGTGEKEMLSHKNELVDFCISNVYEKLSNESKKILQLFVLENQKLTYGVMDYYLEMNEIDLRSSINELLTTYMIHASSGEYVMNDMAQEYISRKYAPKNEFVMEVFAKRKKLKLMIQEVKVRSEQAPFNPNAVSSNLSDVDKQLATYNLIKALDEGKNKQWDLSKKYIDKAASIEPNYFEVYKVKAFLEAERGELYGAMNNYKIALVKCTSDKERAIVLFLTSIFYTIKMQDLDSALECIEKADQLLPNTTDIMLEKVRVYSFMGKYEEAERLWYKVKGQGKIVNLRTLNIMANRYMDLKKRQAEILQNRDYLEKYRLLKEAICSTYEVGRLDVKAGITLMQIITALSYCYYYPEAMQLIADTLEKYDYILSMLDGDKKKRLLDNIEHHKNEIDPKIYSRIYERISDFKMESQEMENDNEGVVIKIKDTYGFISNYKYSTKKGLFFSINNAYEGIRVGDKVHFDIYQSFKGEAAKNVVKIP